MFRELRPWADPAVLALHRLPMHVPLTGFTQRSLDGTWQLELFEHPDHIPAAAFGVDRRAARRVEVPGNWTLQDVGSVGGVPHYTDVQMPFPGPPVALPDRIPTGVYRRTFDMPKHWARRRTVIHVGGAESVHAVYVNGAFVGYGTDSRLPSEYEISSVVTPGSNDIAIVVARFSAHSYIEDQDQWWMAGLHRSVWIESRPRVHIADLPIDVTYDPATGAGTVGVVAHVDVGGAPSAGWVVRAALTDPNGVAVARPQSAPVEHRHTTPYLFTGFVATVQWSLQQAQPWSAERPDRYAVVVELVSPRGAVVQTERQLVGVRSVEVRDRQLLVNGRPVWVFGVNRHDHHPDRGKAVTTSDIRADLTVMRQHNISAIRTSHYPNDDTFYDLCDELGFYVVDEANIEAHAYNRSLCDDPRYRAGWVERGARMVQRDRNHPSVIVWSLGNESGYGANHDALAGWIRHADPTRPLQYEDIYAPGHNRLPTDRQAAWDDRARPATDIVCPMYPAISEIEQYARRGAGDRPLIMCEYSHAMGNSNGSLADYWDMIAATPGLQGGFLWEWKDHALRQHLPDGTVRLAYGGQFGDEPHDGNRVVDGLVSADLRPHPAMREVAWVYRPVTVTLVDTGGSAPSLLVENRRSFTSLGDLRARWEHIGPPRHGSGGGITSSGVLTVPAVSAGDTVLVPLPVDPTTPGWVTVWWELRADSWFAPAGHVVAWDQIELTGEAEPERMPGRLRSRSPVGGASAIEPHLQLWRAATDNDGFKLMPEQERRSGGRSQALTRWLDAGLDRLDPDGLVEHRHDVERVETGPENSDGNGPRQHPTYRATGELHRHSVEVPAQLSDLPRVGVTFTVPARFSWLRWFGLGPHENYPDRRSSATFGRWEGPIDEPPYLVPQEYGLRMHCAWMELVDQRSGEVVRISAVAARVAPLLDAHQGTRATGRAAIASGGSGALPTTLHMAATRHSPSELFAAATDSDLSDAPDRPVVVHLDVAHRGLGTASCGPDVLDRYRLPAGTFEFAYLVTTPPT